MKGNQYNIKFNREFGEGLVQLIELLLGNKYETDDDRLLMAGLAEIKMRINMKLLLVRKDYSISLTPVQSLSLRIMYTDFINDHTSYMGVKLLQISNEVKQKFNA